MLDKFLTDVDGLNGMIVSSMDSMCFGQAWKGENSPVYVATVLPLVAEQISKLQWGELQSLSAEYENVKVVHVKIGGLVFSFIGSTQLDEDDLTSVEMMDRLGAGFAVLVRTCKEEKF